MATNLTKRIQMLDVDRILYFYKLELPKVATPLLFHNNGPVEVLNPKTNAIDMVMTMTWQGQEYTYVNLKTDGMQLSGDGSVNSPTMTVANNINGQDGALGVLCRMYNNLKDAKLTIHMTTLEAYQAGTNQYMEQLWWISRKTLETAESIEFALDMPANHNKQQIPTRIIDDICAWAKRGQYRGEDCGYTGTKYFDARGNPVDSIALDDCGGLCSDCELRFGRGTPLPFGGFLINFMRS